MPFFVENRASISRQDLQSKTGVLCGNEFTLLFQNFAPRLRNTIHSAFPRLTTTSLPTTSFAKNSQHYATKVYVLLKSVQTIDVVENTNSENHIGFFITFATSRLHQLIKFRYDFLLGSIWRVGPLSKCLCLIPLGEHTFSCFFMFFSILQILYSGQKYASGKSQTYFFQK